MKVSPALAALALNGALTQQHAGEISAPAKPYACHNKPRPVAGSVTHVAQAGWVGERISVWGYGLVNTKHAVTVQIRHVMSTDCVYGASDKAPADPRCAGCQHINQGAV